MRPSGRGLDKPVLEGEGEDTMQWRANLLIPLMEMPTAKVQQMTKFTMKGKRIEMMGHMLCQMRQRRQYGVDEALENGCMVHKMGNERQHDKRGTECWLKYGDRVVEINVIKFGKVFCGEGIYKMNTH